MKAEYNKWYECYNGNMPEDFENVLNESLLVRHFDKSLAITVRCKWLEGYVWLKGTAIIAWMLPEPYKENAATPTKKIAERNVNH